MRKAEQVGLARPFGQLCVLPLGPATPRRVMESF